MWKIRRFQRVIRHYEKIFENNIQKVIEEKEKYISNLSKELKELQFLRKYNQLLIDKWEMLYSHNLESTYDKKQVLMCIKKRASMKIMKYYINKYQKRDKTLRLYRERLIELNSKLTYHHLM